ASLYMNGGEIFNFTLRAVPPLVARTAAHAQVDIDSYDAFLFHQANMFMLKHLTKKAKLPADRVPINIDRFGNTSSASIPLLMTTDMGEALRTRAHRVAMFGFGVGYSWASASLSIGSLGICETIER
ncbi:MAG: 3-oxoacyl-ACP synthase III family protein, partial [Ramlibacter sp.]